MPSVDLGKDEIVLLWSWAMQAQVREAPVGGLPAHSSPLGE